MRHAIIWIEILRSTGVQTGQSRLHNVKIAEKRARLSGANALFETDDPSTDSDCLIRMACRAVAAKAGGADRDRTDDLKLAKLALSQLSYGP